MGGTGAITTMAKKFNPPVGAPGASTTSGGASTPDLSVAQKPGGAKQNGFGLEALGDSTGVQVANTGEVTNTKKKPTTTLLGQKL